MANREMAEMWNGPASAAWVDAPDRYDAMLEHLGLMALDAVALQPGERVLDVGCGSGHLAREAARRVGPEGRVLGVDVSQPLVELAVRRGGGPAYALADAQADPLPEPPYDVLVSRFGVMFFDDPAAAFAQLRGALTADGRAAFVCWQSPVLNEWVLTALGALVPHVGAPALPPPGAPGPFAFADADRVREVLQGGGWIQVDVRPVESSVLVGGPGGLDEAMAFYEQDVFGKMLLSNASAEQRANALGALREALAPRLADEGIRLGAAVWVVTARPN